MSKSPIELILKNHGPMLTSQLSLHLQALYAISAESARKQISRRPSHVHTLAYLPFAKGARFIYCVDDYGTALFWNCLEKALEESSKGYSLALKSVRAREGIIPLRHFQIACGSPKILSKHLSAETILKRMQQAKLLHVLNIDGVGQCVTTSSDPSYVTLSVENLKARILVEKLLLDSLKTWAKNLALGSFNKFQIRDEKAENPVVGPFEWDMTSPSYLMGLTTQNEGKPSPGFFVCDLLLNGTINEKAVEPFIHKLKTIRNLHKIGRLFPIFVAEKYTREAFQKLREVGAIPATQSALFGEEIADGLKMLMHTLADSASHTKSPEKFDKLFSSLSKLEGAIQTMRGAFFEYIVADLLRKTIPNVNIRMNNVIMDNGKTTAEVDIILEAEDYVSFIECKGLNPARVIPADLVKHWLDKLQTVRQWALTNRTWQGKTFKFEFWSTSRSGKQSYDLYEKAKRNTLKYELHLRDRNALSASLSTLSDKHLKRVFEQHFLDYRIEDFPDTSPV